MKRWATLLTITVLTVVAGIGTASAQTTDTGSAVPAGTTDLQKVTAYVQPSIVYLDITWTGWVYDKTNKNYLNDGNPFSLQFSCTGFVVNPDGYIATAGHCVDPTQTTSYFVQAGANWAVQNKYYADRTLTVDDIVAFDSYRIEGDSKNAGNAYKRKPDLDLQAVWSTTSTEPLYDNDGDLNGEPHEARVQQMLPWNDGSGDTALLKVDVTNLPPVPIAPPGSVTTGTNVVSVGYPGSVQTVSDSVLSDPSFKSGSISSVRTNSTFPVYEMSAPMSGGMSGGPTVDLDDQVIGINSYGINGEVESFEFVQSSETLSQVMSDAGIPAELGEIGTAYRAGLDAFFAGDKATAVNQLTKAVTLNPDFDMAKEYLTQAQALPDAPVDSGSSSPVVPILVGLAIVLIVAAGVWFLRKRSNSSLAAGSPSAGPQPSAPVPPSVITTQPVAPEQVPDSGTSPTSVGSTAPTSTAVAEHESTMASADHFCPDCGTKRLSEQRFCGSCGHRFAEGLID